MRECQISSASLSFLANANPLPSLLCVIFLVRSMSIAICSLVPLNLRNRLGWTGHVRAPLPACWFVALTMTSSRSSMHASEMPCWTRSRAAAAAAAMVGKDETATVEGRRGASLSVAASRSRVSAGAAQEGRPRESGRTFSDDAEGSFCADEEPAQVRADRRLPAGRGRES